MLEYLLFLLAIKKHIYFVWQVVILQQVLVDEINVGYQHMCELQLLKCNGATIRNLKHLKELIESTSDDDFIRFEFDEGRHARLVISYI